MAIYFLGWELEVLEERVRLIERRLERRTLRDTQNPYELPRSEFMDIFRLSPELSMDLTNNLRPFLKRDRNSGIPVEIQVIVLLKLLNSILYILRIPNFKKEKEISYFSYNSY